MRSLPIRLRLTVWYSAVFSMALAAFGVSVWLLVRQRLYDEVHDQLEERVMTVQRFMAAQKPGITPEHMRQEMREEYEAEDQVIWLQVLDQDGTWMFRAHEMAEAFPEAQLPGRLRASGTYFSARVGHARLEVIQKPITVAGKLYTVEAGVAANGVHHTLVKLRKVFLLLAPCFMLIAAFGSYYLSRRALRAVDEITAMARSIHERNLHQRLPSLRSNDELQRLSETLNEMLGRIETAFTRTRQFTADASHELRTPISLIRTEAELALRKTRSEDEYRNALAHILTESERTTDLIESLLTLARTDSGAEVVQLEALRLNDFLRHCAEDWEPLMQEARLRMEVDIQSDVVWVSADERLLRRLIIVLLDNARKYTPEGRFVRLYAAADDGSVVVGVADTGIGIEPEHLPHIFDRFYRADKARSRKQGGTGLGLSLAKWIATQHGTEIVVQSTPGSGSTFSFSLPRIHVSEQKVPTAAEDKTQRVS